MFFEKLNLWGSLHLSIYSFFVNTNAFLKSFNVREGPYISTPPRYILAPNHPNNPIVKIRSAIETEISQIGTSNIPTRKYIIIGEKNGIKEVIVINLASGIPKPKIGSASCRERRKS